MLARSYLYVPGDSPKKLAGAFGRGADAVILDLEDAVSPPAKARARELVAGVLRDRRAYVRVNADSLAADLDAIVSPGLLGVVVPKATPALLADVNARLDAAHAAETRTIPLIETAAGVLAAPAIAATPRVLRLGLGEADLAADLGMRLRPDRAEMMSIRVQLVVASAAAGIAAPIGPAYPTVAASEELAASTRVLLSLGFRARTVIHPGQIATVNAVFQPTDEELARARATLAVFEASADGGRGVGVLPDGQLVDLAVVRSARDVLSRWQAATHPA